MDHSKKEEITYAFIDSQNLNLGVKNTLRGKDGKIFYKGWNLDFKKFKQYLIDKYKVSKAYLFIGLIPGNESLYKSLQENGFVLIFKPTLTHKEKGKEITKGNVDAELVLHASAIEFASYDQAVIVSGDGDFRCLYEFLVEKGKLLKVILPNKLHYSSLLRPFSSYFDYISNKEKTLGIKK